MAVPEPGCAAPGKISSFVVATSALMATIATMFFVGWALER
jgi:hypothetical protein